MGVIAEGNNSHPVPSQADVQRIIDHRLSELFRHCPVGDVYVVGIGYASGIVE